MLRSINQSLSRTVFSVPKYLPLAIKHARILCFRHASNNTKPELTSVRYNVQRGPYSKVTDNHVQFFDGLLGQGRVLTDPDECESYNIDWIKMVRGASKVVVKPKTTEEVSAILRYCNENRLAVCPQSGNTGLVGGNVPVFDEIIISMKLMNNIISTDELSGTLVCQAGCILENLEKHLENVNLMMPLDLGAKGSCLIGGCVSTNAGGLRLLRYGNLHGNILGLEAVKANGEVVNCLNTLKKDNTGYHIKHMFIGSEGTLGIVTKVAIQCPPLPKSINVAFLGLKSFENVLKTYKAAKRELGEILSSCELIDKTSLEACTTALGLKNPLDTGSNDYEFYVLLETSGSETHHDEEKFARLLEKLLEEGIISDGTLASEPTKIKNIWTLRESLTQAVMYDGYVFKYDISMPLPEFYKIVEILRERLKDPRIVRIGGYGHLGDGNLHLQVSIPTYAEDIASQLEPFIFEYISKQRGSISAEHGIGFKKTKFLHYSKDKSAIQVMRELKKMMDPNGILNPYKVLDPL
ncbi:D-2-hydroxyglutarate dehydrogenase, mitochondrial [Cephus cinctus]|uniref:D-2-hydroxyglutarate dehydrogenase, mitochondrial n=1 Tax=Cephus cinctus TaxID=211228 RepID=A0AAJ7C6L8_CEPCN|nr:D-2-hydroxyglutarate dehydrogenase, mitochondrial [Cephus cinctus]XP_015603207.1 D-2-hydroxyglutarate dehydrogenase, mitochondrial [Cephus cinctus]XP_015603215.1 D-2-hydroxyglutarate dehydrogenase, mitochondrial [Cephus cinctus]